MSTNIADAPLSELHADFMELSSGSLAAVGDQLYDAIRMRIGCATALKYALPSPLQATFDITEMQKDLDIASDLCRWSQLPPAPASAQLSAQISARLAAKYGVTLTNAAAATSPDEPLTPRSKVVNPDPPSSSESRGTPQQMSAPAPPLRSESSPATPSSFAPSVHLLVEVVIRTPESTPTGVRS